jgi:hypothetical protein
VADFVEPFMTLTRVIAGALIEKLNIADGVGHTQLLHHRGESVGGELHRASAVFFLSTLPLERRLGKKSDRVGYRPSDFSSVSSRCLEETIVANHDTITARRLGGRDMI